VVYSPVRSESRRDVTDTEAGRQLMCSEQGQPCKYKWLSQSPHLGEIGRGVSHPSTPPPLPRAPPNTLCSAYCLINSSLALKVYFLYTSRICYIFYIWEGHFRQFLKVFSYTILWCVEEKRNKYDLQIYYMWRVFNGCFITPVRFAGGI
jgi:hypothetical protein